MKTVTKNLFKVLFLMMISMSLLVTTSCEDDDDVDEIIGTWVMQDGVVELSGTTVTPNQLGLESITVEISALKIFTATTVMVGVSTPMVETGTWERTNSTTVVTTGILTGEKTMTKEGEFYVRIESTQMGNVKFRFKKQ